MGELSLGDPVLSKGCPWSEEEHKAFLRGLESLGKGNWRGISRMFVPSRNPTQVASHAQKYFLRLCGCTKRRSRFSGLEGSSNRSKRSSGGGLSGSSNASPTSSESDGFQRRISLPPPSSSVMLPMPPPPPFMLPPPPMAMFAVPGGAPFFAPVFFPPPPAAFVDKNGVPMVPMFLGPPPFTPAAGTNQSFVKEGGDDSAPRSAAEEAEALAAHLAVLCHALRPEARPATRDSPGDLLGRVLGSSDTSAAARPQMNCHVALQASAFSAFKPAGRSLTSV